MERLRNEILLSLQLNVMTLLQGDKGHKGDSGPMGLPGAMGYRGESGPVGPNGRLGMPVSIRGRSWALF